MARFIQSTNGLSIRHSNEEPIHLTPFHDGLESMIDAEHLQVSYCLPCGRKTHTVDHLTDVALKDLDLALSTDMKVLIISHGHPSTIKAG